MNPTFFQRKPKPSTDMGVYGKNNCNGYFLQLANEEKEIQICFPSVKTASPPPFEVELPPKISFNEDVFSITTQAPENLSDDEEESKFFEKTHLQIEELNAKSCKIKESHPLSNKGEALSPLYKFQAKMAKVHPFRNLIFNPDCPKHIIREHLKMVYKSLVYGVHHLKKPKEATYQSGHICLGEQLVKNQKTLFLDLDETLIHSCSVFDNPSHIVQTEIFNGEAAFGFNVRPYCLEFLKTISKYYEVFIFTAASESYANYIIDVLDPENKCIRGILFRDHCLQTKKGISIKDLGIIKNRELKNMVIIDNNAHSFALQLENGIPILEWKDDKNDRELKYILHYLMELSRSDDVRTFNKKFLKLEELSNLGYRDF